MLHAFLVFLGGGLGSLSRYGIALWLARPGDRVPAIPASGAPAAPNVLATLLVNAMGCVLIGLTWGRLGDSMRDETRLLVVVGFLGGFTTFSAIGWETFTFVARSEHAKAGLYVATTLLLGAAGVWIGHALGTRGRA